MKFARGAVVHHKMMGKGVVLNETDDGMVEVRMANGIPQKFYPEELETDEEVQARDRRKTEEVVRSNEERAERWKI